MRVLFANHTASFGGAEDSMVRLAKVVSEVDEVAVACPTNGRLTEAVQAEGIAHVGVPEASASLRLGVGRTANGLLRLLAQGVALRAAAWSFRAEVVHANTIRTGLSAAVASTLGGPPVVVRTHDVLPDIHIAHVVRRVVARHASSVVGVSEYSTREFNDGLGRRAAICVHPSIDLARFDPEHVESAAIWHELDLGDEPLLVGMVAQITRWKAHDLAIRAVAKMRESGVNAHLLLVGTISFRSARYDNEAYEAELHSLVERLGMTNAVHFLGHRSDIAAIMKAFDVFMLPSQKDPFPLVVSETMAMGTPVIVSASNGAVEMIEDGVSGRVVQTRDPNAWARAALDVTRDRATVQAMGAAARQAVEGLTDTAHAEAIRRIHVQAVTTKV